MFCFLFFCFLTLPRVVWLKFVILSLQNHHLVHAWTASSATAILFNTPLEALHCVKVIIFQFDFCFRKKGWNCTEANLACTAGSKWRLCLFPPVKLWVIVAQLHKSSGSFCSIFSPSDSGHYSRTLYCQCHPGGWNHGAQPRECRKKGKARPWSCSCLWA